MRLYKLIIYLLIFQAFIAFAGDAKAFMKAPVPSAKLVSSISVEKSDPRVEKLRAYLQYYNSPLADNAEDFVTYADKYNLDWKFVVSVAGVESWYGQRIPPNSYNGWGWGVYGGKVHYFASWEDGIETISKNIREKYMDQRGAKDVYDIGRIYASDPAWAYKVTNFMNKLETFDPEAAAKTTELSIAL